MHHSSPKIRMHTQTSSKMNDVSNAKQLYTVIIMYCLLQNPFKICFLSEHDACLYKDASFFACADPESYVRGGVNSGDVFFFYFFNLCNDKDHYSKISNCNIISEA